MTRGPEISPTTVASTPKFASAWTSRPATRRARLGGLPRRLPSSAAGGPDREACRRLVVRFRHVEQRRLARPALGSSSPPRGRAAATARRRPGTPPRRRRAGRAPRPAEEHRPRPEPVPAGYDAGAGRRRAALPNAVSGPRRNAPRGGAADQQAAGEQQEAAEHAASRSCRSGDRGRPRGRARGSRRARGRARARARAR